MTQFVGMGILTVLLSYGPDPVAEQCCEASASCAASACCEQPILARCCPLALFRVLTNNCQCSKNEACCPNCKCGKNATPVRSIFLRTRRPVALPPAQCVPSPRSVPFSGPAPTPVSHPVPVKGAPPVFYSPATAPSPTVPPQPCAQPQPRTLKPVYRQPVVPPTRYVAPTHPAPCVTQPVYRGTPPPVLTYQPVQPRLNVVSAWNIRVGKEDDPSSLKIHMSHAAQDIQFACSDLKLKIAGEGYQLCVKDGQVCLTSKHINALADNVTQNVSQGRIHLNGRVKLKFEKEGQKAQIQADIVTIGVKDGRLECQSVKRAKKDPKAKANHVHQLFTHWIGFSR